MFLSASVAVSFLGGSEGVTIQSIGGTVASWRPGFVFWGANTLQKLHLHIPIFVSTIVHLYISVCVYIYVCIYLIYFNHTEIVSQKGYKAIKVCWFDFLKTFSTSNQPPLVWFCCGSICVCVYICGCERYLRRKLTTTKQRCLIASTLIAQRITHLGYNYLETINWETHFLGVGEEVKPLFWPFWLYNIVYFILVLFLFLF